MAAINFKEQSVTLKRLMEAASKDSCAICLEKPMKNPIRLPNCRHAFCLDCLAQSQEAEDDKNQGAQETIFACPLCRSHIPHVLDMLCDRSMRLLIHSKKIVADPVLKCCFLLNALRDADTGLRMKPFHLRMLLAKVDALMVMGKYVEVRPVMDRFLHSLKISTQVVDKLRKGELSIYHGGQEGMDRVLRFLPSGLKKDEHLAKYWLDGWIRTVRYHAAVGEWEQAKYDCETLLQNPCVEYFPLIRYEALVSYCYYLYNFGEYEKCIDAGKKILQMNQRNIWAYHCMALSYAENGHPTEAESIAKLAMQYAVPTDDQERTMMENLRKNLIES